MVEIQLENYTEQLHSCSLEGNRLRERLAFLEKNFFSQATEINEKDSTISLEFLYERKIANEITDLAFFEKQCCGNFTINVEYNMVHNTIKVELHLIK